MSEYPPPNSTLSTFNSANYITLQNALTIEEANSLYLQKQGDQTLNGNLTAKQVNFSKVGSLGNSNLSWSADAFSQIFMDVNTDINLVNSSNNVLVKDNSTAFAKPVEITDTSTNSTSPNIGTLTAYSMGLNNTTDATSNTSGGALSIAGGMAVQKKIYAGSDIIQTGLWGSTGQPARTIVSGATQSIAIAAATFLTFPSASNPINQGGISFVTNRFIIPRTGVYALSTYLILDNATNTLPVTTTVQFIDSTGVTVYAQQNYTTDNNAFRTTLSHIQYFTSGQDVAVRVNRTTTAGTTAYVAGIGSSFMLCLLF